MAESLSAFKRVSIKEFSSESFLAESRLKKGDKNMSCQVLLEFHGEIPQLSKTVVRRENGEVLVSVRGKTAGAIQGAGSFQWTSAVKALSSLLVRASIAQGEESAASIAVLSGFGGSLASTLDYALSKQPGWTVDMFGVDGCGNTYLRRLLLRTNPERKYPGPVIVTINSRSVKSEDIEVWWNGVRLEGPTSRMRLIERIEEKPDAAIAQANQVAEALLKAAELKSSIEARREQKMAEAA